MKSFVKVFCFIFIISCIINMTACGSIEKKAKEYVSKESLPSEYVVDNYEGYLPSRIRYYNHGEYIFIVTYETDSDLITIEQPEDYPTQSSLETVYGDKWYQYVVASEYKVKLSDHREQVNVKCTYYDKTNDIQFVIERTFILLTEGEYLRAKLDKSSSLKGWEYKDGIYTVNTWKKETKEISSSYKITSSTTYDVSYNPATGDITYKTDATYQHSNDGTTSTEVREGVYNMNTRTHICNGIEIDAIAQSNFLAKIIAIIDNMKADMQ